MLFTGKTSALYYGETSVKGIWMRKNFNANLKFNLCKSTALAKNILKDCSMYLSTKVAASSLLQGDALFQLLHKNAASVLDTHKLSLQRQKAVVRSRWCNTSLHWQHYTSTDNSADLEWKTPSPQLACPVWVSPLNTWWKCWQKAVLDWEMGCKQVLTESPNFMWVNAFTSQLSATQKAIHFKMWKNVLRATWRAHFDMKFP